MSNYPPGVSGNEYEIQGADEEVESEYLCSHCEIKRMGIIYIYHGERWFICNECDFHTDIFDSEVFIDEDNQ